MRYNNLLITYLLTWLAAWLSG